MFEQLLEHKDMQDVIARSGISQEEIKQEVKGDINEKVQDSTTFQYGSKGERNSAIISENIYESQVPLIMLLWEAKKRQF